MNNLLFSNILNLPINRIILFGIIIRVFFLFLNSENPISASSGDAIVFHNLGLDFYCTLSWKYSLCKSSVPFEFTLEWIYSYYLGFLYFLTYPSIIIAGLSSIIFWFFSCIVFKLISQQLGIKKNMTLCFFIYALLPSSVVISSISLREIYQLFFFSLLIFYCVIFLKHQKLITFFKILLCSFFLIILHWSFIITCFLILILLLYFTFVFDEKFNLNLVLKSMLLIFLLVFFFFSFWGFFYKNLSLLYYKFSVFFSEGILDAILKYRSGHNISRATYYVTGELDENILIFFSKVIIYYFLKPFPFDGNLIFQDYVLIFENFLRLYLIFYATKNVLSGANKIYIFVFTAILILELIWAAGTVNYGTAVRHHYVSLLTLLVLFSYKFKKNI